MSEPEPAGTLAELFLSGKALFPHGKLGQHKLGMTPEGIEWRQVASEAKPYIPVQHGGLLSPLDWIPGLVRAWRVGCHQELRDFCA